MGKLRTVWLETNYFRFTLPVSTTRSSVTALCVISRMIYGSYTKPP